MFLPIPNTSDHAKIRFLGRKVWALDERQTNKQTNKQRDKHTQNRPKIDFFQFYGYFITYITVIERKRFR